MPRIYQDEENLNINSIDEIPEKYRDIVKQILLNKEIKKENYVKIVAGEMDSKVNSKNEISNFFNDNDEVLLGHGTDGGEEVVSAILNEGLKVKNSDEVSYYMNTLRGLDSTTVALGEGKENFYDENEEILNNWQHKDAKDIIIIALPTKYLYCPVANIDKYIPFYIEDKKSGGYLLRPEFIKGIYNANDKSFSPNKNYYKNLDVLKQEELINEVKRKYIKLIVENLSVSPEELQEYFGLKNEEFEELVANWYGEKLSESINKENENIIEENSDETSIEFDNFDWENDWEYEDDEIIKKLDEETKSVQSDILTIDEIESIEKREIEKQREGLTNDKDRN